MAAEFFRKDELENEITRPEILRNQPYYRNKGKRFTENMAGYAMMPSRSSGGLDGDASGRSPTGQSPDGDAGGGKPHSRDAGLQCLRAFKEMEKDGLEGMLKARAEAGAGLYSGETTSSPNWGRRSAGGFTWDEAPGTK